MNSSTSLKNRTRHTSVFSLEQSCIADTSLAQRSYFFLVVSTMKHIPIEIPADSAYQSYGLYVLLVK